MDEAAPRKEVRSAGSTMFDVPAWLGDLTGAHDWQLMRTFTRPKVEFVADYSAARGVTAQVTLRAIKSGSSDSWELRADVGHSRAGVVIPARTRIKW